MVLKLSRARPTAKWTARYEYLKLQYFSNGFQSSLPPSTLACPRLPPPFGDRPIRGLRGRGADTTGRLHPHRPDISSGDTAGEVPIHPDTVSRNRKYRDLLRRKGSRHAIMRTHGARPLARPTPTGRGSLSAHHTSTRDSHLGMRSFTLQRPDGIIGLSIKCTPSPTVYYQ